MGIADSHQVAQDWRRAAGAGTVQYEYEYGNPVYYATDVNRRMYSTVRQWYISCSVYPLYTRSTLLFFKTIILTSGMCPLHYRMMYNYGY